MNMIFPPTQGSGTATAANRVTLASDDPAVASLAALEAATTGDTAALAAIELATEAAQATLGTTADAASGDATSTITAKLRALAVLLGTTADAAVGDATGTLNAHLRQVAKLLAASLTVAGTAADNAAASGNPVQAGGVAVAGSSYAPAYTAADAAVLPIDKDSGGLLAHIRKLVITDDTVTAATYGHSFVNISTATTTTVKSGAGVLHAIIVNKHVAASAITIYDNTAGSGTKVGIITPGAALLSDPPLTAIYDLAFATGLTIVTAGATDLTIIYR